jgi:hypothetical protein
MLPISDGIDPVRGLEKRDSHVNAVRLPISDGMVPVKHVKECRREFNSMFKCISTIPIHTVVQFYHA